MDKAVFLNNINSKNKTIITIKFINDFQKTSIIELFKNVLFSITFYSNLICSTPLETGTMPLMRYWTYITGIGTIIIWLFHVSFAIKMRLLLPQNIKVCKMGIVLI